MIRFIPPSLQRLILYAGNAIIKTLRVAFQAPMFHGAGLTEASLLYRFNRLSFSVSTKWVMRCLALALI